LFFDFEKTMQAVFRNRFLPYLLLTPTLIILILFLYYPVVDTFRLSFYRSFIGLRERYVGLENYQSLLGLTQGVETDYWNIFRQTLIFSAGIVVTSMTLSLGLAVLASQPVRGLKIYRTLLIWPYALSTAIAGSIFLFLFNEAAGLMTYLAETIFHVHPAWLSNPGLAPIVVAASAIWKSLGYNVIFYIAGLQTIPREVLEAAAIDGATAWQRFWRVVFPLLSPFTFFLLITNISYAFFDTFASVSILTGGNRNTNTNTLMYNLYQDAFVDHRTGPAAAQSILLFALVAAITYLQFRFGEQRVVYGG
jgi:sn-glycerol 3-phosphate transport system permease protein